MGLFDKKKKDAPEEASAEQTQPTNEEQMMRRQSAPMPTAEDEAMRIQQNQRMMQGQGIAPNH